MAWRRNKEGLDSPPPGERENEGDQLGAGDKIGIWEETRASLVQETEWVDMPFVRGNSR